MHKYAFFPGCAAEATVKEAMYSTREVAKHLGIEMIDVPEFSCCGAGVLGEEHSELEIAVNARNMAAAEQLGVDVFTLCNTCLLTMQKTRQALEDDEKLAKVNEKLKRSTGMSYQRKSQPRHFLWILMEDIGIEAIRKKVVRPLHTLKCAPFYGCHMLRPLEIYKEKDSAAQMNELMQAIGVTFVDHQKKEDCCGFHTMLVDEKNSLRMTASCIESMSKEKANCAVTPCTLCHISLDSNQKRSKPNIENPIPIFHLSQLVGLSFGLSPKKLGIQKHFISAKKILDEAAI